MKIIWVLLFFGLLFIGNASAQSGLGLRGGASFSQANFKPASRSNRSPDQQVVQGFEAGLLWRMLNNRNLGFQAELNYSVMGWHIYPGTSWQDQREYHYVQMPLLSHLQLGRGRLKLVVQAGGLVAYAKQIEEVLLPDPATPAPLAYAHQELLPWQYGVVGAAGPSISLPFGMLQLEARFVYYLSNMLQPDLTRTDDFESANQQNITFGLQWVYMFEKKR